MLPLLTLVTKLFTLSHFIPLKNFGCNQTLKLTICIQILYQLCYPYWHWLQNFFSLSYFIPLNFFGCNQTLELKICIQILYQLCYPYWHWLQNFFLSLTFSPAPKFLLQSNPWTQDMYSNALPIVLPLMTPVKKLFFSHILSRSKILARIKPLSSRYVFKWSINWVTPTDFDYKTFFSLTLSPAQKFWLESNPRTQDMYSNTLPIVLPLLTLITKLISLSHFIPLKNFGWNQTLELMTCIQLLYQLCYPYWHWLQNFYSLSHIFSFCQILIGIKPLNLWYVVG